MAEKRRVVRNSAPLTARVRYGRATLTIAGHDGIPTSAFGEAVAAYENGELIAEELCERFVRLRVKEHSASFSWDAADPAGVLTLVVGASERPRFDSTQPEHVA